MGHPRASSCVAAFAVRQEEGGEKRMFDAEERTLDRILQKEVDVGHRARGDREIEEHE